MARFCDDLRRERERQGVTLESVSQTTKLSARHLTALEEGRYAELPGGIFRKGILRSYLGALGVDPAPWLPGFEQALAAAGQAAEPPVDIVQFAENVQRTRIAAPTAEATRWPGVFAMIALLLVFGWCVWRFALRGHLVISRVTLPVPAHSEAAEPLLG